MKRIVEAGRLEIRGADARFKQKGTLEAHDRNLAGLKRVRVRQTPAPKLLLFADFEFEDAIFRVWQESTLIPYKDFLEKVHPTGLANFRAMIGYVTRALAGNDPATAEFVAGKPAERFATNAELADYDEAISAGEAPRVRAPVAPVAPVVAAAPAAPAAPKERVVEEAWRSFAADIEKERAENRRVSPLPGFALVVMGVLFGVTSALTYGPARLTNRGAAIGLVAVGMVLGLAFVVLGAVFLRRALSRGPA